MFYKQKQNVEIVGKQIGKYVKNKKISGEGCHFHGSLWCGKPKCLVSIMDMESLVIIPHPPRDQVLQSENHYCKLALKCTHHTPYPLGI